MKEPCARFAEMIYLCAQERRKERRKERRNERIAKMNIEISREEGSEKRKTYLISQENQNDNQER